MIATINLAPKIAIAIKVRILLNVAKNWILMKIALIRFSGVVPIRKHQPLDPTKADVLAPVNVIVSGHIWRNVTHKPSNVIASQVLVDCDVIDVKLDIGDCIRFPKEMLAAFVSLKT